MGPDARVVRSGSVSLPSRSCSTSKALCVVGDGEALLPAVRLGPRSGRHRRVGLLGGDLAPHITFACLSTMGTLLAHSMICSISSAGVSGQGRHAKADDRRFFRRIAIAPSRCSRRDARHGADHTTRFSVPASNGRASADRHARSPTRPSPRTSRGQDQIDALTERPRVGESIACSVVSRSPDYQLVQDYRGLRPLRSSSFRSRRRARCHRRARPAGAEM